MVGDFGTHEFVIKVCDEFAGGTANVCNEVLDSWEHVVFERGERVDIFVSRATVYCKECVLHPPNP